MFPKLGIASRNELAGVLSNYGERAPERPPPVS
jgi:hypothetical protein